MLSFVRNLLLFNLIADKSVPVDQNDPTFFKISVPTTRKEEDDFLVSSIWSGFMGKVLQMPQN